MPDIVLAVQTPEVARVAIRRHTLDLEASRLSHLAAKVGHRLRLWLRQHPATDAARQPLEVIPLPDEDWRENFRWYSGTVLGLLKEQRERAKLAPHARPPIDDDSFDAELAELAREAIRTMPEAEFRALLQERSVANSDQPTLNEEI